MAKLISIIIPSYNMEKYLRPCCESLVASESIRPLLEVLIVNDGSKDGTLKLARFLESAYPGVIRVIDKPNGNYGSCINRGLAEATGKYIKVLDADDSVDPRNFADFVAFVKETDGRESDIDLYLSDYCVVDQNGSITGRHPLDFNEGVRLSLHDLSVHSPLVMHNILYRTEMLRSMAYRQTEGISYTDNEWCFLPVTKIRAARYFKRDVYRYLVGREGQTVGAAASSRSQKMFLTVLKSMADAYCTGKNDFSADALAYLQSSLNKLMRTMYLNCALLVPVAEAPTEFKAMDDLIRTQLPELYADHASAYLSNLFHFNYVRFLRNHGVWMSRIYLRMVRRIVRLVSKLKK